MTVIHLINATLDGRCDHRSVVADDDLDAHALETITNADAILFGSAKQVLSWHAPCAVRVWSTYCACSSNRSWPVPVRTCSIPRSTTTI